MTDVSAGVPAPGPLARVTCVPDDAEHARYVRRFVAPVGLIVTVGSGTWCNRLAEWFAPREVISIADTTEATRSWGGQDAMHAAVSGGEAAVRANVIQLSGWVSQSLAAYLAIDPANAALVWLGGSDGQAPLVFAALSERITPGSILVVDGGADADELAIGAAQSLNDWALAHGRELAAISRSRTSSAWAVTG